MNTVALQHGDATSYRSAPYDYDTAAELGAWREDLMWPVPHRLSFDNAKVALGLLLASLRPIDDPDLQDVALLSLGMVFAASLPTAEASLAVAREDSHGLRMVGAAPELAYLRGDTNELPPVRDIGIYRAAQKPPLAFARRIARTRSWTPLPRMLATLLKPDAMAISHNDLLIEAATLAKVGFHHADSMFLNVRDRFGDRPGIPGWQDLVEPIVAALVEAYAPPYCMGKRLRHVVAAQASAILEAASRDVAALRVARKLPQTIWAGTGGYWPSRALGIEVLRRGGEVHRFDHGGGMGLNALCELWAATEFVVSSNYMMPTPALANRVEASGVRRFLSSERGIQVSGGRGDPLHRDATRILRTKRQSQRRVTYTPVSLLGYRQMLPPRLPDLVNLDWQLRFTELLKGLPVELTCRPHPVGLFSNRPNPLAEVISLSERVFEDLIADTDVFVFDYVQSTTFYEALCTDRPVVLIDFGLPVFEDDALAMLTARCRIVPAEFDAGNRPYVDAAKLESAICDGDDFADPSAFRSLLVGGVD